MVSLVGFGDLVLELGWMFGLLVACLEGFLGLLGCVVLGLCWFCLFMWLVTFVMFVCS